MRDWRKIYATITESEDVARLSDQAALLLCLLIVRQDDSGAFPYNLTAMRSLCSTRDWAWQEIEVMCSELVDAGIARMENGCEDKKFMVLCKGELLNGPIRSDRRPRLYSGREVDKLGEVVEVDLEGAPVQLPPIIKKKVERAQRDVVFDWYEKNIAMLTPHIADNLKLDIEEYGSNRVHDAISIACEKNQRRYAYIEGILKRWKAEGMPANMKQKVERTTKKLQNLNPPSKGGIE